jgi:hypothetical protein
LEVAREPKVQSPERLLVLGRKDIDEREASFTASGAKGDVVAGPFEDPLPGGLFLRFLKERRFSEGHESGGEEPVLHAVAEEAVVTDAVERGRQDVVEETLEEFLRSEGMLFYDAAMLAVRVGDSHGGSGEVADARIGDGDAVSIAGKVSDGMCRVHEGRFGVNDPVFLGRRLEEGLEGLLFAYVVERGGKAEASVLVSVHEELKEALAILGAEVLDGKKEVVFEGAVPASAVEGKRAARDKAVDVDVNAQELVPSVENGQDADGSLETLVTEVQKGAGRGVEEDFVEEGLVRQCESVKLVWQGKDVVEILNGQKLGLSVLGPGLAVESLAVGTVPIATGIVDREFVGAVLAAIEMAAKGRGAALRNVVKDPFLVWGQAGAALEGGSVNAENILNRPRRCGLLSP